MDNDDVYIQFNGKRVRGARRRKLVGTVLGAVFTFIFLGVALLLIFLPAIIPVVMMIAVVICMVLGVIAYPFDWVLKRLGRVGIIQTNGYGFTLIFDKRMFAKVPNKPTAEPDAQAE